jgi:hypothetical protein
MRSKVILSILALALVPMACFPGEDNLSSVSFQLSLENLGLAGGQQSINNWLDWLDTGDPSMAYDLDTPGQSFFMDLSLTGTATTSELGFIGESISLENSVLTAQLLVSDCQDCYFGAVIFWIEDEVTKKVSTFTGESETFSVVNQTPDKDTVDMDVWLEYIGTIKCTSTTTGRQDQAVTLAAFDIDAMVIFPSVTETATTSGVEIVLPDIPLGREFSVVYRPASGGSYNNTPVATGVKLGVEGQSVEVPFDIP